MYDLTRDAFDLADKYRNPVLILGDAILGQMMEPIAITREPLPLPEPLPWGARGTRKGSRTVIAAPDGAARINPTGSAFLATAGTGDVLTGTIGGLLARGLSAFDAAWAGAYVHGLAGILAGRALGDGTLAGDVAELLPEALRTVEAQA
jgi:NAD(P)H-hydrate epimerase